MADNNFQQILFKELREFFAPVVDLDGDFESINRFLEKAGWDFRDILGASGERLLQSIQRISALIMSLDSWVENPPRNYSEFSSALAEADQIVSSIENLSVNVSSESPIDVGELSEDILNLLALRYIYRRSPLAFSLLEFLPIIRRLPIESVVDGDRILRERNRAPRLELRRLRLLLENPGREFGKEYWPKGFADQSTVNEVAKRLFPRIQDVLSGYGGSDIRYGDGRAVALIGRGLGPEEYTPEEELELDGMMTIGWSTYLEEEDDEVEFGFSLGLIPENEGGPGLFLVPYGQFDINESVGRWYLKLEGNEGGGGFEVTESGFSPYSSETTEVHVSIYAQRIFGDGATIVVGSTEGTRFETGDVWLRGGFNFSESTSEIEGMLGLNRAALIIDAGDGDGFLNQVLPPGGVRVEFDLSLGWSNVNGFHFEGSGGLDLKIPTHVDLGVVELTAVTLKVLFQGDELPLEVGGDIRGNLGPLKVVLEDVGLRFNLAFPDSGGNLGLVHLTPGFKAPAGVGLSIDTSGISGGGFLDFDQNDKRYAGIVQLNAGELDLVGIGLITTRMPDGSDGFSLLINIGVEFSPPIQLPYGFTLSGVGGLIGLNRTMMTDVLREGLRSGTLDSVLFPQDPITNAARIISDLRSVLPPAEDRVVVGPMIKLGWGTPKQLIRANIGIFIELPAPVRIALLGQISASLPDEEHAVIELHIDVLGVLEPEKQSLSIDATLYDSRIYTYALTGDAAARFSWGDNPALALSLGGFHPSFSPPARFPDLRRLTLNLSQGRNLQLYCQAYQAVTANTVQFGATVVLSARRRGATVEGTLSFDTLIYLSPFSFEVAMAGNVVGKYKGRRVASVGLRMRLSGPTPWRARGRASFEVLAWDVSVRFNKTWGPRTVLSMEAVDPWPRLIEALKASESWGARLPAGTSMVEVLAPHVKTGNALLIHPTGTLEVRQSLMPLGVKLQKLGNAPVKTYDQLDIAQIIVEENVVERDEIEDIKEDFAPSQFLRLSDTERLAGPAFKRMKAGVAVRFGDGVFEMAVRFGDGVFEMPERREVSVTYESILLGTDGTSDLVQPSDGGKRGWPTAARQLRGSAGWRSGLRSTGRQKFEVHGKAKQVWLAQ